MLSTIDFRYTRTCYLKLKYGRKLSLSHNQAVDVRRKNMHSETLYLCISTFSLKNKHQLTQRDCVKKKSANAPNLTAKFECDTPNSFRQIYVSFQRVCYYSRCSRYISHIISLFQVSLFRIQDILKLSFHILICNRYTSSVVQILYASLLKM